MLLAPFFRGLARHLHLACLAVTATTAAVFAQTFTPSAADGFDPNVDGTVFAVVAQRDGKILVAGQFANVQPNGGAKVARNNLARFNADGSLDTSFDPNANGPVRAVVVQLNRQILIGGDFTNVAGQDHSCVARLNEDGSADSTFTASLGKSLDSGVALPTAPQVMALAVQSSDGAVIVGGTFGSASSAGVPAVQRNNLARFTSAGALDTNYNPNPNAIVLALAMHQNDAVLVGGGFTQFREKNKTEATSRSRIARVNKDGSVDTVFNPQADNAVSAIAVQRDGKVVFGGSFTTVRPFGDASSTARGYLARVTANGALDTTFGPVIGGNVLAIAIAEDGGILIGGHFTQVLPAKVNGSHGYIARIGADGTPDESFKTNLNADVNSIALQPDGKVVAGGLFTRADSTGISQAVRNHVARILVNGNLDAAFQVNSPGRILASVTQTDGKIVVGGSFTTLGGTNRQFLARLNADGSVDPTYNPNLNSPVYAMAYDKSTNSVVIGGSFTGIGPVGSPTARSHIARIKEDGSVDATFNPNLDGVPAAIVVQSDGAIVVGGSFSTAKPTGVDTAIGRLNLLRLTSAGQVDPAYNPSAGSSITGMALQTDGKIIVVGNFTYFQPGATGDAVYRNYIARLNTDGTIDKDYYPQTNSSAGAGAINAVVLQSDGKAIIGGAFTLARSGTSETLTRNRLARVNIDGTFDTTYDPNADNTVLSLAIQPDNKVVVGGTFTTFTPNGSTTAVTRRYVARLNTDGTVDPSLDLNITTQAGTRVDYVSIQAGGDILVGGNYTSLQPSGSAAPVARNHLARIKAGGALDTAFDLHPAGTVTNTVNALSIDENGKILVGGKFAELAGAAGPNLARFNPEGTPDFEFNNALSTDGEVNAIALRPNTVAQPTQLGGFAWLETNGTLRTTFKPTITTVGRVNASVQLADGSVILGGLFSATGSAHGNLIKLKPSGELDPSFSPDVTNVYGLLLQPDGKLIIYGNFTTVNGTARGYIARLNPDGSADDFNPNANSIVYNVVRQSNGSLVLGGAFTTLTPGGGSAAAIARNYLARVDAAGVVDTNFIPNPNAAVYALALQDDGQILVGGDFSAVTPGTDTTATTRNHIARFTSDGKLDPTFDPNIDAVVYAIALQPTDKKIVVGGGFTTVGGAAHANLARLETSGAVDASYSPAANAAVQYVTTLADGSSLISGFFTTVTDSGGTTATSRHNFARITNAGKVDASFNPGLVGQVTNATVGSDNSVLIGGTFSSQYPSASIVIGGAFTKIGGLAQPYLAELNGDGSVSAQFQPNPDAAVNAVAALTDGRLIVGGAFTKIGGASRNGIARFTGTGALDPNFNPAITGPVATVAVQSDGRILVGAGGLSGLIRLNTDGTVDGTFAAALPFIPAVAIAIQADGKIVVAGAGSGVPARIARLNADGSADPSFTPVQLGTSDSVRTLTLQTDGSIIVAGSFATIGGQSISNVARLTSSGAVDTTFNPGPNGAVTALALQGDGRLLLGGAFTAVGGLQRFSLARVGNTGAAQQTLGVSADGKTITWVRTGTVGEVAAVSFDWSTDQLTWTRIGEGSRSGSTSVWQITNVSGLPATGNFYVRARAIVPTSAGKSEGLYEAILLKNLDPSIQTSATPAIIAPVVTSNQWDASHYVWTRDSAGTLRIADVYSFVTFDSGSTVLINGGTVGGGKTSASSARLADLSTRGLVSKTTPLISGFAIVGSSPRPVLIRAAGPGLLPFGVTNVLKVPQLVLYNNAGTVVATNSGWNASLLTDFAKVGAFPFSPGSTDSAFVVSLQPGTYTVQVADGGTGEGGDALIEIYDAGDLADTSSRLMNLSTRGTVNQGATLIGGLVVSGNAPKTLLVRGVGPALAHYGVSDVLADPGIAVYDAAGAVVAINDNWSVSGTSSVPAADYAAAVSSASRQVGAFLLDADSKDAALVVTLPAGAYTVQLRGNNGTAGGGMIEVYELP